MINKRLTKNRYGIYIYRFQNKVKYVLILNVLYKYITSEVTLLEAEFLLKVLKLKNKIFF